MHDVRTARHSANNLHDEVDRLTKLQWRVCCIGGWETTWSVPIQWNIWPATSMLWLWHRLVFIFIGNHLSLGMVLRNVFIPHKLLSIWSTRAGRTCCMCCCCTHLDNHGLCRTFDLFAEMLIWNIEGHSFNSCLMSSAYHEAFGYLVSIFIMIGECGMVFQIVLYNKLISTWHKMNGKLCWMVV